MSAANNSSGPAITGTSISPSTIIQASYLIVVILTSVLGNLFIIVGIWRKRLLRNVMNCFILNLCISDFLNASLKMTTTVAGLFDRDWYPSNMICYFTTPFGVLFGAASVLSLTSVALARYLIITLPFAFSLKVTPSVVKFVLAGVWGGSILLSFPPVTWRPAGIICRSGAVSEAYQTLELVYIIFLWAFVIALPSALMLTSYVRIFRVTSRHIRRITSTEPVALRRRQNFRRFREVRAAVVLALIGGIFILCWFPFFVILTLHKFASEKVDPMYFKIFLSWMYTNSALNPILLILFNNEIRSAVRQVLPCSNPVPVVDNTRTIGCSVNV